MVLPLLGTRRPESLPVEALEGIDDILKLAITRRNSGALLSCDIRVIKYADRTRCGGDDLM